MIYAQTNCMSVDSTKQVDCFHSKADTHTPNLTRSEILCHFLIMTRLLLYSDRLPINPAAQGGSRKLPSWSSSLHRGSLTGSQTVSTGRVSGPKHGRSDAALALSPPGCPSCFRLWFPVPFPVLSSTLLAFFNLSSEGHHRAPQRAPRGPAPVSPLMDHPAGRPGGNQGLCSEGFKASEEPSPCSRRASSHTRDGVKGKRRRRGRGRRVYS